MENKLKRDIILKLNIREATILRTIFNRIGGNPDTTIRGEACDIAYQLPNNVEPLRHNAVEDTNRSITFTDLSVAMLNQQTGTFNPKQKIKSLEVEIEELSAALQKKRAELEELAIP